MKVAPGIIVWFGQYPDGAWGAAVGRRAHWWIDLEIWSWSAVAVAWLGWAVIAIIGAALLYGELLTWHDLYEDFLRGLRHLLWLEHPA